MNVRLWLASSLVAAATLLLAPAPAAACGGFFCVSAPVEQNAERILFEVDPVAQQVTAVVEIRYNGDADDFAWVVPVSSLPESPELDVAPGSVMTLLELSTTPTVVPPPTKCSDPWAGGGVASPTARGGGGDMAFGDDDDDGVDVIDLPQVGPYAPQRITSDDPQALVEWLNENGYLITDEMEPAVADYVARDYDFLGMKLAPEAGVADIQPIVIRYPGTEPMIPIVLTSVAAEPEMAILAFIADDTRYEARNFANLEVTADEERMQADPQTGTNNYYPLLRWMTDEQDGRAFVTEFAGPSDDVRTDNVFLSSEDADESYAWTRELLDRHSVLTRLYTKISGHEMALDPSFVPVAGLAVDGVIDLSGRDAIEVCGPSRPELSRTPCGVTYCGVGALCATTDTGLEGCVCPAGQTARSIQVPSGPGGFLADTVTCMPANDLLADVMGTVGGPADPCAANVCGGNGECLPVNGFATCACDEGFAAVPNGLGGQTCETVVATYGPEQIAWGAVACSGCALSEGDRPGLAALVLLLPLALRRRRPRAA